LNLNWSGRNSDLFLDRVRNIDSNLNFSGYHGLVRYINRYVNIVVHFHVIRSVNFDLNSNRYINRDKDLIRHCHLYVIRNLDFIRNLDLYFIRNLNLIGDGNLNFNWNLNGNRDPNLDLNGVRTSYSNLDIIRYGYIHIVGNFALTLDILNNWDWYVFITGNFNILNLFNRDVDIDCSLDKLFRNNGNVVCNYLFNRYAVRDLDIIRYRYLNIIGNRYTDLLINISITILVDRLRLLHLLLLKNRLLLWKGSLPKWLLNERLSKRCVRKGVNTNRLG